MRYLLSYYLHCSIARGYSPSKPAEIKVCLRVAKVFAGILLVLLKILEKIFKPNVVSGFAEPHLEDRASMVRTKKLSLSYLLKDHLNY